MPVRRAARRNARRRLRHATRMPRRARPPAHATGAAFRTSRRPRSPRSAALATLRTASSDEPCAAARAGVPPRDRSARPVRNPIRTASPDAPCAAARPAFRLDRSDARGRFPSRPRVP
ncbi:hypothetical protein BOC49_24995 [Burkholderia pseudomallei]|nr:hypothetical protein BOC49_24995 [Burkholderia pseudomallei]